MPLSIAGPGSHVLLVRGRAGGTALTGTVYEPGEEAPRFSGAPAQGTAYTWVCDEFFEFESGGVVQEIDGREIQVAFESPVPRGFETRETAVEAAKEHVRTQFARLGVADPSLEVVTSPQ